MESVGIISSLAVWSWMELAVAGLVMAGFERQEWRICGCDSGRWAADGET